jgi:glutamate carboxypeptidase
MSKVTRMDKTPNLQPLADLLHAQTAAMLDQLRTLVSHETPSGAATQIDAAQQRLAAEFDALGFETTIQPAPTGGHLRAQCPGQTADRLVVLTHIDTVWPLGTIDRLPFRVEGDKAFGPGTLDMKASIVQLLFALRALRTLHNTPRCAIEVLVTADEEVGSESSRALIEARARGARAVLVLEPPTGSGALKTARKGVGRYTVTVTGRAAHAGVEVGSGINALVELAHQILAATSIADLTAGTTVNVGVAGGGTRRNVVPATAEADIDFRVTTLAEGARVAAAFAALRPILPGAQLTVVGGLNRPPFERTAAIAALFAQAQQVVAQIGFDEPLREESTGGGSDGNFTAALGVPTLDGLGVRGVGAHADHEHIQIASLPRRAHLLAGLLALL